MRRNPQEPADLHHGKLPGLEQLGVVVRHRQRLKLDALVYQIDFAVILGPRRSAPPRRPRICSVFSRVYDPDPGGLRIPDRPSAVFHLRGHRRFLGHRQPQAARRVLEDGPAHQVVPQSAKMQHVRRRDSGRVRARLLDHVIESRARARGRDAPRFDRPQFRGSIGRVPHDFTIGVAPGETVTQHEFPPGRGVLFGVRRAV